MPATGTGARGGDYTGSGDPASLVRHYESGGNYNVGWGGTDLSNAPRDENGFPIWAGKPGPAGNSRAAGAYQFQPGTWAKYAKPLGIKDFSPESQDKVFAAAFAAEGWGPWAPYNPRLRAEIARRTAPGSGERTTQLASAIPDFTEGRAAQLGGGTGIVPLSNETVPAPMPPAVAPMRPQAPANLMPGGAMQGPPAQMPPQAQGAPLAPPTVMPQQRPASQMAPQMQPQAPQMQRRAAGLRSKPAAAPAGPRCAGLCVGHGRTRQNGPGLYRRDGGAADGGRQGDGRGGGPGAIPATADAIRAAGTATARDRGGERKGRARGQPAEHQQCGPGWARSRDEHWYLERLQTRPQTRLGYEKHVSVLARQL